MVKKIPMPTKMEAKTHRKKPTYTLTHFRNRITKRDALSMTFRLIDSTLNTLLIMGQTLTYQRVNSLMTNLGHRADMVFLLDSIFPEAYYINYEDEDFKIIPTYGLISTEQGYQIDTEKRSIAFEKKLQELIANCKRDPPNPKAPKTTIDQRTSHNTRMVKMTSDMQPLIRSPKEEIKKVTSQMVDHVAEGATIQEVIRDMITDGEAVSNTPTLIDEDIERKCRRVIDRTSYIRKKLKISMEACGKQLKPELSGPKGKRRSPADRLKILNIRYQNARANLRKSRQEEKERNGRYIREPIEISDDESHDSDYDGDLALSNAINN